MCALIPLSCVWVYVYVFASVGIPYSIRGSQRTALGVYLESGSFVAWLAGPQVSEDVPVSASHSTIGVL